MQEAAALEEKTSAADFWNEPENSQKVLQRIKQLKDKNARYQRLHGMYEDVVTTIEMAEEMQDESLFPEVQSGFDAFMAELDSQTLSTLLTGEYDKNNAIMQPGDEDLEKLWADESYAHALRNQDAARAALYELCESRGVGIDVMKAYGGGDLLDAALSPFGKAFTPVQCIHYALTRPAAAAVMCGCKTPAELDAALAWLDATPEQRDYSGVLSGLDRFTFEGHCLYCGHCAPCPAGIDVAAVTRLLNLCRAQGRVPESERGHYDLLTHHGRRARRLPLRRAEAAHRHRQGACHRAEGSFV